MGIAYLNCESEFAVARRWLILLLFAQALANLFWLSPAAHSGQVAIPWLMLRGKTLFGAIWEQHAPGSSLLAAAAQALLPLDPALVARLLNALLVALLTLLVYWLARRLCSEAAGLAAALVFAWWLPVYGNVMLYFDTLLALCVLAGLCLYFARCPLSWQRLLCMGLCFGAATLFKQHAWLAVAVAGLWLLADDWRRMVIYLLGALLLPLLQWLALAAAGLWDNYLYWNWAFNLSGLMDGLPLDGDFLRKLLLGDLLVLPFALLAWRQERRWLLPPLLWLAALSTIYPRVGEIHAMAQLPFAAVMSGVMLAKLRAAMREAGNWDVPRLTVAGLALGVGIGWLWTGAVSYLPTELDAGATLGYDEFRPLAEALKTHAQPGDTLFILPQADSTPQLHPLTGLLPPGTWVKGWRWYFRPPHVLPHLKREWADAPPDWVIVFPDLLPAGAPGIYELLAIVKDEDEYELAFTVADIYWHGRANVYARAP
ncbi:MAG: hypothetical protein F4Y70_15145 [Chloroflexi bacterium]|nr:glycosyltransferase family 39 protein [Chloroflexota bacterium]MCY3583904.1 glycosyltransferase family 39 protein [Chloroflexota bacterium]MXX51500.1 hypothetical protein [Chloroflexota bacterium]MXX84776.1 hypothetical protein [Chloroflexota bacterium]MYA93781.1 hypothetical protein [Chloroflexota bacterium]